MDDAAGIESYETLALGRAATKTVDLIEGGYEMSAPGEYEIEFPGAIRDLYGGSANPARRGDDFEPPIIYCKPVVVRVTGP